MPSKNSLADFKTPKQKQPVLPSAPPVHETPAEVKTTTHVSSSTKPKVKRINKGFQVEEGRVRQWDILVAQQKSKGKTGPKLIDEAMDYLFSKYGTNS